METGLVPASKCLAARSPNRTVPETAHTTTILIRFPVAIDIVDAPSTDQRLGFDFLRFDVVFADIAFPGYGGSGLFGGLTRTLSPSRFVPDLSVTIACFRTRRLNGTGKPKLTETDGL
jgi:hypothetical protein